MLQSLMCLQRVLLVLLVSCLVWKRRRVAQSLSVSLGFIASDQSSANEQPAPVHKWYCTAAGAEEDWRAPGHLVLFPGWAHWRGLDFFRMSISSCLAKASETQIEQRRMLFFTLSDSLRLAIYEGCSNLMYKKNQADQANRSKWRHKWFLLYGLYLKCI